MAVDGYFWTVCSCTTVLKLIVSTNKSDHQVLRDYYPKNLEQINQAESETGFWFCSEPINNSLQCPEPNVQSAVSIFQCPYSSVQSPESRRQRPESSVQSPVSSTWVQSPKISCLEPSITKKVNSYALVLRQQPLTTLQIQNFH